MFLQYSSVVLLLVRLVDDVADEDLEVVNSVSLNNVAHVWDQDGLFDPVFQIHEEPEESMRSPPLDNNIMAMWHFVYTIKTCASVAMGKVHTVYILFMFACKC